MVFLTDNPVLVRRHKPLPALVCGQRSSPKIVPTEKDLVEANIASFGNDVGTVTNYITSMYEVRSRFEVGSPEYNMLQYRIKCGQQKQQDAIDKAKGIVSKPMEKSWYDIHAASEIEDEDNRQLYMRICADKKPYFMKYIYPKLKKEYNKFVTSANKKCYREFGKTFEQMQDMKYSELSDGQKSALHYYEEMMPVGYGGCVMNKICRMIEREFDGFLKKRPGTVEFDYSIMKSGEDYPKSVCASIKKLIKSYNSTVKGYLIRTSNEKTDADTIRSDMMIINEEFSKDCHIACQNDRMLCNVIIDLCYSNSCTKMMAWRMCAGTIIDNLLKKNGYVMTFPILSSDGDIEYCGNRYTERIVNMGDKDDKLKRENLGGVNA